MYIPLNCSHALEHTFLFIVIYRLDQGMFCFLLQVTAKDIKQDLRIDPGEFHL